MAEKINYSSNSLLNVKFSANTKGYDASEVDMTLDKMIADYHFYEKYYSQTKQYIQELEKLVGDLKEEKRNYELEIATLKNRLKAFNGKSAQGQNNLELVQKISKLEYALYQKGIDPTKIK